MKLPVLFLMLVIAKMASAAQPVTATASSSYSGREPIRAVDGSGLRDGAHDNELDSAWHSGLGPGPCWFRVDFGKAQPVRWLKLWNLNWASYTERGIRQADVYWSADDQPGNPIDNPERWKLAVENQRFTRASHWPDYGRNPQRRMPDMVDLGELTARFICLTIDSNFTESGRGYFGISEIAFSSLPFPDAAPLAPEVAPGGPEKLLLTKTQTIDGDRRFYAPDGGWNLSEFRFVEFDLHNPGDRTASLSCWVFAPNGWGGLGTCPRDSGVTVLEPGERAKVLLDLHARFIGQHHEGFCKVIDASHIDYAEVIYHLPPGSAAVPIEVVAIRAVGSAGDHTRHDIAGRLRVPEITGGEPAAGKRVRDDRHVLYLPTDWRPGSDKKYPIIIEYPGNVFYNQFCYSPGKTEYGRLGWGLAKDLGDPDIAGDGFIWLNLPFINRHGEEQISGFGDAQKTVDYCLKTLDGVANSYGGDLDAVIYTGFSRGSLAANYIGLRSPQISGLIRGWHRAPTRRAPADEGGWGGMFAGHNNRIDQNYQGQSLCPRGGSVTMGPRAHVDCGYLEDRPDALAGRKWLRDLLADELDPLRNDRYNIWPQPDGSLRIANKRGGGFDVFRPEFTVIHCQEKPAATRLKWTRPIYNLPAWKLADGAIQADVFKIGEVIPLSNPKITRDEGAIVWTFDKARFTLAARVSLPAGEAEPRIDYRVAIKQAGYYTFGYTGAASLELDEVARLWQPLVWDGRRLPEQSFLIGDDHCSIPGCLVQRAGLQRTFGVMADPWQFPFEMPYARNRKFGVAVRSANGTAQPQVFAPFIQEDAHFKVGDVHEFAVLLVAQPHGLSETFEYVARNISGFRDRRENTLTTLNQSLDNMVDFALSKWAAFDAKNKSSYYPDAKGTVKNVSCLHPFSVALVRDNARVFHEQTVPIMEYLLSREKFLFAITEEGLSHSQKPSMNMAGPAMPVSELAALHRISRGSSPIFLEQAKRLYAVDRRLNMSWITAGATWQRSLAMYRATGDRKWLADATAKANVYIAERIDTPPMDFEEASDGTFFEYMVPWWKELYELYLETRDPKHLAAAHAGARRYAQFVWFYPSVPDGEIAVNPRGRAPRRGRAEADGELYVPRETVPAWRVSDQGLTCEGNGTAQRLGILIATHAPFFLRIANDTNDGFLRDIARSAVIGRYANFPGYHLNTRFSTAQEKPDFPLHNHSVLKPTTSIHYNHILPQVNLVIDYLMASAYDLSDGAVDFPTEFIEGYAFLQSKLYGARPGRFYNETDVWPWMPKRLLTVDHIQANYVAARGEKKICLAFMNASDRPIEAAFTLNPSHFQSIDGQHAARVWKDNQPSDAPMIVKGGVGTLSLSPKGITAVCIEGLSPKVSFQTQLARTEQVAVQCDDDVLEAAVLSFGRQLRWLYAYVKSGPDAVEEAVATVTTGGKTRSLKDDSYPFEFSVPIAPSADAVEIQARLKDRRESGS